MSDPASNTPEDRDEPSKEDEPSGGPNLVLMYSLIALALAAAIGFALLIVRPFYLRR
jgi:hypothetical protein